MAGASMNAIKSRIKSVESTRQITKAMELVATSKLRRAKERAEGSRPYHKLLWQTTLSVMQNANHEEIPFLAARDVKKTCYIVIAGDRGLAGGYNANVFRLTRSLWENEEHSVLPIGKKAVEYYTRHGEEVVTTAFASAANITPDDCIAITALVCDMYEKEEIDRLVLVYTGFRSMLQQQTAYEQLLPFTNDAKEETKADRYTTEPLCDGDIKELISYLIPLYLSGVLSSAVDESLASECASRRNAMNSANKNADEIIGTLQLHYNRARQAAITQEITEIVSGAEAL
ncbi:MAG: ATP synthase F1 subunit gamma [Ruminococcaceae bacterium]|nr:ATP synthase F1 subunit gamma [Oscillospiraceae bacterium]